MMKNEIYRETFIRYGYKIHYWFYTWLFVILTLLGGLNKNHEDIDFSEIGIRIPNTECSIEIEIWFGAFILFCPIAAIIGSIC